MRKNKQTPWTDKTEMPWGKNKGTPLKDIPPDYFIWLKEQSWLPQWPQLAAYIEKNADAFKAEKEEEKNEDDETKGYTSYQDFLDDR